MTRPAGTPNKNKQALLTMLKARYPEYHPVLEMAAIANNDVECPDCKGSGKVFSGVTVTDAGEQEVKANCESCAGTGQSRVSMDMIFNANKEVAQYVTPKLKAVEHSGQIDSIVTKRHRVTFRKD